MPLTRSEICKRYREKQKSLDLQKYKELEKDKNKKYYARIKNEAQGEVEGDSESEIKRDIIKDEAGDNDAKFATNLNITKVDESGFVIYKPLTKRINTLNKSILQPQTVKIYLNSFKKIYKSYTKKEVDEAFETELVNVLTKKPYNFNLINKELSFLKTDLYNFIKTLSKNDLQYLYSILTRISRYSSIIKKIYPYLFQKQVEYQQSRDNASLDANDKIKYYKLSFNKDDVLAIINHFNDGKEESDANYLTIRDKLLFALFTLFPVRRPIDYLRMLLTTTEPGSENKLLVHNRNNYYYNKTFYFNRTKNKEIQKFKVPDELDSIINDYIKDRKSGSFLLNNNNEPYNSPNLSIHIMQVFNKIYGISISAVELRHYYSTYINYLVKNKKLTEKEHRDICNMMNHSYEENKKYSYDLA